MKADIIVAEMTGLNHNVLYELGLAHAAKKPVLMITQKSEEIPFDLKDIRHIPYNINRIGELKNQLSQQIKVMLHNMDADSHDFFPELEIFSPELREKFKILEQENSNLASLAHGIEVKTNPAFSYIFFNNRYMGIAPQILHVNPYNEENIITVFSLQRFEEYHVITEDDLKKNIIHIELAERDPKLFPQRVNKWLKYIRKQPNDVVIGRAIATYLDRIGEYHDAITQLEDLLKICKWSMLYNGIGHAYRSLKEYQKALECFQEVKKLEKSFISHFNIACICSLLGHYEDCINELQAITNNHEYITQFKEIMGKSAVFDTDPDFANIIADPIYGPKFSEVNTLVKNSK
jgi:tetratricopeptide (TPR) repeat protein